MLAWMSDALVTRPLAGMIYGGVGHDGARAGVDVFYVQGTRSFPPQLQGWNMSASDVLLLSPRSIQ